MFFNNLPNQIFWKPIEEGANKLCIISGYATPNMASWLITNIREHTDNPIDISLIVGMVPFDGLSLSVHEGFKELQKNNFQDQNIHFNCSYICENPPVHSKIYIWIKDNKPFQAYCGSANFTQSAFGKNKRESMTCCEASDALNYFQAIENDTIYCNHAEIEEHIIIHPTHPFLDMENAPIRTLEGEGLKRENLSLLSRTGDVGIRSGINWGQRHGRNPNQAYIPLPANIARSGFFPLNGQHFTVITDDHHQLILRIEQAGNKAITTPLSNAQLGEYLRNRLNLPNGAFISKEDLTKYGRSDITFYKLDDEQYYMDFSV